ncbi:MAG: sulfatase-like hydrolase/transferase, partial [Planctomycetota bacterium]
MRNLITILLLTLAVTCDPIYAADTASRPNIVLVMADDQGWGETSFNGHPILKTPELDAMALAGLRMNRFYAGAPVCSPTRAAVLTGRSCHRAGVPSHGYALRHQEITLPALLAESGYQTAHFGKWHLNGLRGPGIPILRDDPFRPDRFGFQHWLSVTNFFDRDPILGRSGPPGKHGLGFEEFEGDSSDVIVQQAVQHIAKQAQNGAPFLTVIWFGTPHSPFKASESDRAAFGDLPESSQHHYGELVALDRSVGALRSALRKLAIADNTLVWYCSDNGGLPNITPPTVGGLRGNKGLIYEGGLRVPGIIEWPGQIDARQSDFPASVMDIMPTILELTGIDYPDDRPIDGIDIRTVLAGKALNERTLLWALEDADGPDYAIRQGDWKLLVND